jgi:hypothetical protein
MQLHGVDCLDSMAIGHNLDVARAVHSSNASHTVTTRLVDGVGDGDRLPGVVPHS